MVSRKAHNLEIAGSNPAPARSEIPEKEPPESSGGSFYVGVGGVRLIPEIAVGSENRGGDRRG